jgi:hypothetical protein
MFRSLGQNLTLRAGIDKGNAKQANQPQAQRRIGRENAHPTPPKAMVDRKGANRKRIFARETCQTREIFRGIEAKRWGKNMAEKD